MAYMWCFSSSVLGPFLFLIYVIDLQHASKTLDPIMFTDDTNLFYSHQDINTLFSAVILGLEKTEQRFKTNK